MNKIHLCEWCHDTGWYGDNGPGIEGNTEYLPCDCGAVRIPEDTCTCGYPKPQAGKENETAMYSINCPVHGLQRRRWLMPEPKFHVNQVLKILYSWAGGIPPRPVENIQWDELWNCYTYAFPLALIRIEEHELEAVEMPDITPEKWTEEHVRR